MKKNNQRGFVLAEAFIVSTFVLAILVFMFLQIKTIINGYDKSFSYNTIPGIYNSREVKKFIEKNNYNELLELVNESGYVILDSEDDTYSKIFKDSNIKTVIITKGDLENIKQNTKLSQKLQNYIKTLVSSDENQLVFEYNNDTFVTIKG